MRFEKKVLCLCTGDHEHRKILKEHPVIEVCWFGFLSSRWDGVIMALTWKTQQKLHGIKLKTVIWCDKDPFIPTSSIAFVCQHSVINDGQYS